MRVQTPRKKQKRGFGGFLFLCFIGVVAGGGYWGWQHYVPSFERLTPVFDTANPLFYQGEPTGYGALVAQGGKSVKLPLKLVQELLGPDAPVRYEEESESIILTTSNSVMHFKTDALTATMNQQKVDLSFAAEKQEDTVYLPFEPLQELYGLQFDYAPSSSIVTIHAAAELIQTGSVAKQETELRSQPTIKAPIVESLQSGAKLRLWGEEEGWYKVQASSGYIGYVAKSAVVLGAIETTASVEEPEPFVAWKLYGQRINLTWEAVYSRNPDLVKLGELEGVNVVSPTWFALKDAKGQLSSKADKSYVNWAHGKGMQVWALFSNSFDPDMTTTALASYESRQNMIRQLIAYAQIYKLQGINIDFENVYTKDKENLVQFVREMTPLLHEQGLVVSMDVTPKSNSEMWSAFIDRAALGKVVDFMMVMAYDEHWASSPVAGSVASLPWVEQSVKRILEEDGVPSRKLILGIPLYTRVWTEQAGEDGKTKVSSKAIGMEAVDKLIEEKQLQPEFNASTGQHYIEYQEDGARKRIWMEDEVSIKARAELAKKYDLGGVASWARVFQKPAIWPVLDEALQSRP